MVHPRILAWHNDLEQQKSSVKGLDHEWSDMDDDEAQEAYWG